MYSTAIKIASQKMPKMPAFDFDSSTYLDAWKNYLGLFYSASLWVST